MSTYSKIYKHGQIHINIVVLSTQINAQNEEVNLYSLQLDSVYNEQYDNGLGKFLPTAKSYYSYNFEENTQTREIYLLDPTIQKPFRKRVIKSQWDYKVLTEDSYLIKEDWEEERLVKSIVNHYDDGNELEKIVTTEYYSTYGDLVIPEFELEKIIESYYENGKIVQKIVNAYKSDILYNTYNADWVGNATYEYDINDNIISILRTFTEEGIADTAIHNEYFTFNEQGDLLEKRVVLANQFTNYEVQEYDPVIQCTYNEQGLLATRSSWDIEFIQDYTSDPDTFFYYYELRNASYTSFEYDEDNRIIETVSLGSWDADFNRWNAANKRQNVYNEEGQLIEINIYQSSQIANLDEIDWQEWIRYQYDYNENGFTSDYFLYGLDQYGDSEGLILVYKESYFYEDSLIVLANKYVSSDIVSDSLELVEYREYINNDYGNLMLMSKYVKDSLGFILDRQTEMTYDSQQNRIQSLQTVWEDSIIRTHNTETIIDETVSVNEILFPSEGGTWYRNPDYKVEQVLDIETDDGVMSGTRAVYFYSDYEGPATSLAEMALPQLTKAYPNPSSDWVQIALPPNTQEAVMVRLYDLQGRLIQTQSLTQNGRLDVSRVAAGTYVSQFEIGAQKYSAKIVVK